MRAMFTKKRVIVLTIVALVAGVMSTVASAFLGVQKFEWWGDRVEPETPTAYVEAFGSIWFDFWSCSGRAWSHTRHMTAHHTPIQSGTSGQYVNLTYSYGCAPSDAVCITTSTPPLFVHQSRQHKDATGDTACMASIVTLGAPFRAMWTAELDWDRPSKRNYQEKKTEFELGVVP